MSVAVILPWRGGCEDREAIRGWVERRYAKRHSWPVVIAEAEGEWCKPKAIRAGLEATGAEIVIVADADVWCDGLRQAVRAVKQGAAWGRPHTHVYRLDRPSTAKVLAGAEPGVRMGLEQRHYRGTGGGAYVVALRETLLAVPPDIRFTGWGAEDGAWRDALRTLAGREWIGKAPLFHLWHPAPNRHGGRKTSPGNAALAKRYIDARGDREAMRRLVEAG